MNPAEAHRFLDRLAGPGEPWVRHSRQVGRVARLIGSRLGSRLDPVLLEAAGLLHDVGRSVSHGLRHPWEGWLLLERRGAPALARVAVTHWLKGRSLRRVIRTSPGVDPAWLAQIFLVVRPRPLGWLDLAVSVADSLVAGDRVVSYGERYGDLVARYGETPGLGDSKRLVQGHLARLSRAAGVDLERWILAEADR